MQPFHCAEPHQAIVMGIPVLFEFIIALKGILETPERVLLIQGGEEFFVYFIREQFRESLHPIECIARVNWKDFDEPFRFSLYFFGSAAGACVKIG